MHQTARNPSGAWFGSEQSDVIGEGQIHGAARTNGARDGRFHAGVRDRGGETHRRPAIERYMGQDRVEQLVDDLFFRIVGMLHRSSSRAGRPARRRWTS